MMNKLVWKNEEDSYIFKSNMTKAEWKEFTHSLRADGFDGTIRENKSYAFVPTLVFCHSISYGVPKISVAPLGGKGMNFITSCRKLYTLYKNSGEMEEAYQQLEDARDWAREH